MENTINYHPVGSGVVDLAVATALTNGVAPTVRVYLRSTTTIATPTTYIGTNNLTHEVISQAGLSEETTFTVYTLVDSYQLGGFYYYVVDALIPST